MIEKDEFNSLINQIIDSANIVQIISEYIPVKQHGSEFLAICPFHPDSNPSLHISPKKKIFKCFVCKKGGNVITFVQLFKKISFLSAASQIANAIGLKDIANKLSVNSFSSISPIHRRTIQANEQANEWYRKFIKDTSNIKNLEYLIKRFKNESVIKEFGIGYATKNNENDLMYRILSNKDNIRGNNISQELTFNDKELEDAGLINVFDDHIKDTFINRFTFPIYNHLGYLVGFSGRSLDPNQPKYLNTKETKLFKKNQLLYNFYKAKQACVDNLVIVEGFADVIAYVQSGIHSVAGLMGTALTNYHLNLFANHLPAGCSITLSLDNDDAGTANTLQIGEQLLSKGINVEVIDYGNIQQKDPDEIYCYFAKEKLQEIYAKRIDFISWLIKKTIKSNMSQSQLKKNVEHVLKLMSDYNEITILDRSRHLQLINEQSNIPISDLQTRIDLYLNKDREHKQSNKKKSFVHIQEDPEVNTIANHLVNMYNELIAFLLTHNEFINDPRIFSELLSSTIDNSIKPHIKIINQMRILNGKGINITNQILLDNLTDYCNSTTDSSLKELYTRAINILSMHIQNRVAHSTINRDKLSDFITLINGIVEQVYELRAKTIDDSDKSNEEKIEQKTKILEWFNKRFIK